MVSEHFGHCEHFGLIDVDEERKEILRKELVPSPGHQPALLLGWLAEQGVSVVIAVGMGARAFLTKTTSASSLARLRVTQRKRPWTA